MANGSWQDRLTQWMAGRNGTDDIARLCSNTALILIVIYVIWPHWWISLIALVLIGYAWYRIASKDVAARARENEAFMSKLGPLRPWVSAPVATFKDHRAYAYLTCPSCGQKARVPRGKGKVRVRCRRCHTTFEGKA
ncbi:hypothetical protein AAK684_01410 [Leptogranulimonas caecicola]|uniref:Zn-finger containing protein n=2 Tax=Coriobacteriales TaxID=84999 RepID=A0A4S2F0I9_9ACTN|nr:MULTISPECIES: hypothetical protein [Atopobiaceae]MCI8676263.1 hypothetical protein [Atopobiaceae bacterium]TGY62235.1 hypothetical protein E5334_06180 [Muricaecibacterium torontonense]BCV18679.1 hypothetical protein ATOBIA_N09690 [Atopobiaceae bacterium P1]BDC91009.1 hypothetical protein ATTO_08810 [Leptogranulimonas caecicola]